MSKQQTTCTFVEEQLITYKLHKNEYNIRQFCQLAGELKEALTVHYISHKHMGVFFLVCTVYVSEHT
mgnify:CR=1 FL=1